MRLARLPLSLETPTSPSLPIGRFGLLLALCTAALASACGGHNSGGGNNSNGYYCEGDDQCPAGMVCRSNACVEAIDAAVQDSAVEYPDIALSEETLDFQSPLLGTEVVLPLTIFNTGNADLQVTQIVVDEPGSLQEFHVDQEGSVQITVPPGGEHALQVSLLSLDDQLDTGALRIFSNDPDENPVVVNLVSTYKGTASVQSCVLSGDATPPYPAAPLSDCEVDAQGDPVVDFGLVHFDEPQTRVFALWNNAQGNAPLTINSISISNNTGHADTYAMSFFTQDPGTGDASPASLPHYLSAGDSVQGILPDVLYVQVDFDASVDVFPEEQVEVQTNDPNAAQVFIPIIGILTGCPQDQWDVNNDPSDGCEYHCVFRQTTEDCTSAGVDDNCNGEIDEEDADGCTVYYRDHDGDTYGATGDFRCLCTTEGEYTATNGLDCDDDDQFVKPGVPERCITPYDDNCDGSDNDPGAQGCTNYLKDEDGDTYGVSGDSQCLCYASGNYTSTLPGDCDDNPAACGAACNPAQSENCTTPDDDNCNGDANEMNAPGCTTYYRDFDGDTYGHQTLSQCWCYPHDDYTADNPSDCDDSDPQINPAATEVCDHVDNNCVAGVDEGFNLQSDPQNCGACNTVCANPHGTTQCISGVCDPTCYAGYGDCNGDTQDGCETDLSTVIYCGFCGTHTDCPSAFFCNGGTCEKQWSPGHACTSDIQCGSGFCRDGVCCNSDCGGVSPDCQACNLATHVGTCTPYSPGNDPENACSLEPATSCGQNGFCDGSGGCALHSSGTQCVAESCSGSTHFPADTCDGAGTCTDSGTDSCAPYVCGGSTCKTSCSTNADCIVGYYCGGGGTCLPQTGLGDPCTVPSECSTGFCEDGVCCNQSCSGVCRACNMAGSAGTCIEHPAGTDPEAGCGMCNACNGSGGCAPAAPGTDPKNQCDDQRGSNPCGQDGTCDGTGACRYVGAGTICVGQSCTSHVVDLAHTCDGVGTCQFTGTSDCTPYQCSGTSCGGSCAVDADCVAGYYCTGAAACAPLKDPGDTCLRDGECGGGAVCSVDGVCCDSLCNGTCESCTAGVPGTCTAYATDTDPENECGFCGSCDGNRACRNTPASLDPKSQCNETASSTCGTRDWCDGSGACDYWAAGTTCGSASCNGALANPPPECDGGGNCNAQTPQDCSPYLCSGGACLTTCTADTQCIGTHDCIDGNCCLPGGSLAGATCGTGSLVDLTNGNPRILRSGNVDFGQTHWYRFRAAQNPATGLSKLKIWTWFTANPAAAGGGTAFRFEVRRSSYTDTDCTPNVAQCGQSDRFYWYLTGCGACNTNENRTWYVGVTRVKSSAAGHECDQYTLAIQVGGTAPW